MLTDALRLLQSANSGLAAARAAQRAAEAAERRAWGDALEAAHEAVAAVNPALGDLTRGIHRQVEEFRAQGRPVEGAYTVIEGGAAPWSGFVRRVRRQRWGGHVILGQPGSGKTTLARKLATVWQEQTGYPVEAVNVYPEDLPAGAYTIGMDTLTARMRRLGEALRACQVRDEEDAEEADPEDAEDALNALVADIGERIVLIDEASLGMGNTAADPARRSALQALAQCRHLSWLVLYVGQWAGQLPLPLFGLTTVWVKQPTGEEEETDRDNRVVRALWRDAASAFGTVRESEWWPAYPDRRSWAFVAAPAGVAGSRGYRGLVPFRPTGQEG